MYKRQRERTTILHGIDLELNAGECLGIIGESGSGKSTLGRVLCGLLAPDSGRVLMNNVGLYARRTAQEDARIRNKISIVFQDYTTSVNPRFRVHSILHESFRALRRAGENISSEQEYRRCCELLERVGLNAEFMTRYPHELSGGQLQRACICRSMMNRPKLLFADEPTGALNRTSSNEVMDELVKLNNEGTTIVMVTHDAKVAAKCGRVLFIVDGNIKGEYTGLKEITCLLYTSPSPRD